MTDWRADRDRALLTLEREKRPAFRTEAALQLYHLASEVPEHAAEFLEALPGCWRTSRWRCAARG